MNRFVRIFAVFAIALAIGLGARASEPAAKVDLNKASVEELVQLPKIGPAVAQRIVEYRKQSGGFRRLEDLLQVRGIGPRTFELLKGRLTLGETAPAPTGR